MAKDMGETVRDALGHAVREAVKNVGDISPKTPKRSGSGPLSGARGLAAGAGLAAAAPLAKKGVDAIRANGGLPKPSPGRMAGKMASKAGDKVAGNMKDVVSSKVDEAGGAGGLVKDAASGLLPGSGGDGGGKGGMPGVGKGRRMPVQQAVDVAVDLETAYNQFTQFEDWPQFMHRVTNVSQDDECTIHFTTKIWGKTKEYEAKIETQRPDDRIKWKVSQGITHAGVVSFHELAPRLTRIEVSLDVDPGSLLEKAARGMRHIKRAIRADLHRFKAFIEMQELETGAWRGVIEDGELVEPHDDSYDEERDYSEVDDLYEMGEDSGDEGSGDEGSGDEDDDDDASDEPPPVEELPRDRSGRFSKGAGARPVSKRSSSRTASDGDGNGNGRAKTKSSSSSKSSGSSSKSSGSSSKSGGSRSTGTRKRGSSNGSESTAKRSTGTRRRSGSRS